MDKRMSKYDKLWEHMQNEQKETTMLTFDEVEQIAGVAIDHSFLKFKKELMAYGFEVKKISLKEKTVLFQRLEKED